MVRVGFLAIQQAVDTFALENRKYIGSKVRLLGFLDQHIRALVPRIGVFADPFAGTGVVAHHFAQYATQVVAADLLYSNYLGLRTFIGMAPDAPSEATLAVLVEELNRLQPVTGYCSEHFGDRYFTRENAGRIDAARDRIELWHRQARIDDGTRESLITALLYAADKVANTVGQYDSYLKHLGQAPYDDRGRHLVDASAYRSLRLAVPHRTVGGPRNQVCQVDANVLMAQVEGDVLYLDPPYNARQYIDNYHVLENIALWQRPALRGVTRKFDRTGLKSRYSSRRTAGGALAALVAAARFEHIFLSYNCEGILQQEELLALLGNHGPVNVFEASYNVFGNGAGRARKRQVRERLYYLRKRGV